MENSEKIISFLSGNGTELFGKFIFPIGQDQKSNLPLVVMLTGDGPKGSKSLSWINIPAMLSKLGIASFVFDFEGLGFSKGERKNLCLSIGLDNINKAMEQVYLEDRIDKSNIALFGSSFGGNIAILYAATDKRIKALGLKSPVSFYPDSFLSEYGESEVMEWTMKRYTDKIGFNFDFYMDAFKYNTYSAAMKIACPSLITHGNIDKVVPISQSKHLHAALNFSAISTLKIFDTVGHQYSEEGAWESMAAIFVQFFNENLK